MAFPPRRPGQPFPERKAFLHQRYRDLTRADSTTAAGGLLVLQHNNVTAAEMVTIRRDLGAAFAGAAAVPAIEIVRTGLLRAALPRGDSYAPMRAWLCGPTCIVRLAAVAESGQTVVAEPADIKRVLTVLQRHRKLMLLGGRFDQHWLTATGIREAAELPSIDMLRAQLVALLETPAQQLRAVLDRIPGDLARTLDGHRANLEKAESA
ncbi:hypothetical protein THASP1DRAFT_17137 [Thamnocephalis sphaerospora]|uniref:50S ribosomal protein L10 n=1 Tax=Thamnocephalis sphaerospora TaxID=78915 RepID=A0A4V1IWF6_9FUNG|nr:hypothetical protein THASP1DRAFT_17137 [Thamnocephalis sphaerospora]|eukprot:RKP07389.1 hypothetical protein THASP1DRAFT_17137 [Thamnocephalis sphaerospora]